MTAGAEGRRALDRLHRRHGFGSLGIAVSGGGDSVALLRIAVGWAEGRGIELQAATVNHGLRPEAAAEAQWVADLCKRLGVSHATLRWTTWDGRGNLQDAARSARRRMLAGWAEERGLDAVALGHTRDDQAETVLMRLARGSGVDGLSGMPVESGGEGPIWLRPLLDIPRVALRDDLRSEGQSWIEDPTNDDPSYDRVKARLALAAVAPLGIDAEGLVRTAARMRRAGEALRHLAATAATSAVRQESGDLVFDRHRLAQFPDDTRLRLLSDAVRWVGGADYRPRFSALEAALSAESSRSVGGTIITPASGTLRVAREPQAVMGLTAPPGEAWDRWIVAGPAQPADVIAALGDAVSECPGWRDGPLPRRSLMASPAVWRDGGLVAAPLAGLGEGWSAQLCPRRDDFAAFLISR